MIKWVKNLLQLIKKYKNTFSYVNGDFVMEFKKDLLGLFPYSFLKEPFAGINKYTKSISGKVHLVEEEVLNGFLG